MFPRLVIRSISRETSGRRECGSNVLRRVSVVASDELRYRGILTHFLRLIRRIIRILLRYHMFCEMRVWCVGTVLRCGLDLFWPTYLFE